VRQACKVLATLASKEGENAVHTCRSDTTDGQVRAVIFQAGVGTCARAGGGHTAGVEGKLTAVRAVVAESRKMNRRSEARKHRDERSQ